MGAGARATRSALRPQFIMRKIYRQKARSCALCHPNKVGWESRHMDRDLQRLRLDDREMREAVRN